MTTGPSWGVYGQRFSTDGARVGTEFQVNTANSGTQWYPQVASFLDGGFVVVWWSGNSPNAPIIAQRYDALGNKIGNEIQVVDTGGDPSVVTLADGGFVVTYESSSNDTESRLDVFATRFNSSGEIVGNDFKVNTFTTDNQWFPTIAALADGGLVIVWTSYRIPDGTGYDVKGQIYNAMGEAKGGEILINTSAPTIFPVVSALPDGGFVVTWRNDGQDGSSYGVAGRVFDSSGNQRSDEFQINSYTQGEQANPAIAVLSNGSFVVAWSSEQSDRLGTDIVLAKFQPPNNSPSLLNPILDQNNTEDAAFAFQFATNVFIDPDLGDTLTYAATLANGNALPSWLSFNAVTQTFSGTPDNSNVGTLTVKVTVTDGSSASVSDEFDITVANVNDAPTTTPVTLTTIAED